MKNVSNTNSKEFTTSAPSSLLSELTVVEDSQIRGGYAFQASHNKFSPLAWLLNLGKMYSCNHSSTQNNHSFNTYSVVDNREFNGLNNLSFNNSPVFLTIDWS